MSDINRLINKWYFTECFGSKVISKNRIIYAGNIKYYI